MAGDSPTWRDTAIWERIDELASSTDEDTTSNAAAVKAALEHASCLPAIEEILRSGPSQADFTLHDDRHSFRVAKRMVEIIPPDVFPSLNVYELALLLLSAYLHDIGMTPSLGRVHKYEHYLRTGASDGACDIEAMSAADTVDLQRWLDNWGEDVEIPMSADSGRGVSRILQYYCRDRHVAWGLEWIDNNLDGQSMGTYAQWTVDLKALCQSHHEGHDWLAEDRNCGPRLVAEPGVPVNFRYLAMVLRVADVMEFDPERTSEVVYRHRDVARRSAVYWQKDHAISSVIARAAAGSAQVAITARPPDATIHNAVASMVDDIEAELALTRRLTDEHRIKHCPGWSDDLPHRWDMPAHVQRNISPLDDAYVYIDGAFRPNTEKLLQLFGGAELYGDDPFVFARELLQNAFDAVREQIAYDKLADRDSSHPEWDRERGDGYFVELSLESDDEGRYWLTCSDNGVGMTQRIIERYVLVSGNTRRPELQSLERRCAEAGIELNRTGQFGIGVLSYFMAADRVRIETRRSQGPGDDDGSVWAFETDGVGTFGELRPLKTRTRAGTVTRLRIRDKHIAAYAGADEWFRALEAYLRGVLRHVPCRFALRPDTNGAPRWAVRPGWVLTHDDLTRMAGEAFAEHLLEPRSVAEDLDLMPETERVRRLADAEGRSAAVADATARLRWWTSEDAALADGLGRWRAHIPYFTLDIGSSPVYLGVRGFLGRFDGVAPCGEVPASWRGMHVSLSGISATAGVVELDLRDSRCGSLTVDRRQLVAASDALLRAARQVTEILVPALVACHASTHVGDASATMWRAYAGVGTPAGAEHWTSARGPWEPVSYPVALSGVSAPRTMSGAGHGLIRDFSVALCDCGIAAAKSGGPRGGGYRFVHWHDGVARSPDRFAFPQASAMDGRGPWPVWSAAEMVPPRHGSPRMRAPWVVFCDGPAAWSNVASVRTPPVGALSSGWVFVNPRHTAVGPVDASVSVESDYEELYDRAPPWPVAQDAFAAKVRGELDTWPVDPRPIQARLRTEPEIARKWLRLLVTAGPPREGRWTALLETHSDMVAHVWTTVLDAHPGELLAFVSSARGELMYTEISAQGYRQTAILPDYGLDEPSFGPLPYPGDEWIIDVRAINE